MPLHHIPRSLSMMCLALVAIAGAGTANAQVLVAFPDTFSVPHGGTLVIEAFGVLDNDLLDDESAGESGATAELVTDVSHGTLALGSDGSFSYSPGPGFNGSDSFVYRAVFDGASDEATVTLTACTGGPQIFTCWTEGAFLAKAAELGHPSFSEGFEDDAAWGAARSPDTVLSVSHRGFEWRANDFDPTHYTPPPPSPNHITTGAGAARTGAWGIYDREHGYATGSEVECNIDNPPAHCLYHDGVTVAREPGQAPFFGAGGYFGGTHGANVAIVVDGDWQNPIGGGKLSVGSDVFFGVIDAGPVGLAEVQFREIDGKVGQALYIFADDFTILSEPPPEPPSAIPGLGLPGIIALGLLLLIVGRLAESGSLRPRCAARQSR